jgi:AraC family transcriptional regulator, regulatory protein of adaptative response / methylated-DNA-[protein]-cysteine methyltransferase
MRSDASTTGVQDLPWTAARMYRALVERDDAFDGRLFFGVKSTGIFCRPTCAARKPLVENVEFFATARQAMFAGYRSCKRCRPMEDVAAARSAPAWAIALKREADDNPGVKLRDADLRARGFEPSTVRRVFQSHYGSTFQQYARARRMGLALAAVRAGKPLGVVKMTSGHESDSGIREAFARLFGETPAKGVDARVLMSRWIETPLGAMLAVADDAGLRVLDFVDRRGLERQITRMRAKLGCVIVPGAHRYLDAIERELKRYFAGESWLGQREPLGVPLAAEGTPFQREVWAELQRIPLGETRSYGKQAASIGKPEAVRAVARANGENFLSLVIPCHRVIGASGDMTGYGGGIWRKQWLLDHEMKMAGLTLAGV